MPAAPDRFLELECTFGAIADQCFSQTSLCPYQLGGKLQIVKSGSARCYGKYMVVKAGDATVQQQREYGGGDKKSLYSLWQQRKVRALKHWMQQQLTVLCNPFST